MGLSVVFRRVTGCFQVPEEADTDLSPPQGLYHSELPVSPVSTTLSPRESTGRPSMALFAVSSPGGRPMSAGGPSSDGDPIQPGAEMESVDRRALRPPGHLSYLKPAKHNPGYWYHCSILSVSDIRAKVRFDGWEGQWEAWVNKGLIRPRQFPDQVTDEELPAGTLVEVQVPDQWDNNGEPLRWSWWAGTVQVYSRRRAGPGQITVALDLAPDCASQQITVSRRQIRVILPAGRRLKVQGAGIHAANGVYEAAGFYDGVPRFECGNSAVVRYGLPSGTRYWYICNKQQLDVDDGDFYRIRCTNELPPIGPQALPSKWLCAKDGQEPLPTIGWIPEPARTSNPQGPSTPTATAAAAPVAVQPAAGSVVLHATHSSCPVCPICRANIPAETNEALNQHIDECLANGGGGALAMEIDESQEASLSALSDTTCENIAPQDNAEEDETCAEMDAVVSGSSTLTLADGSEPVHAAKSCVICYEANADTALVPCGHLCMCEGCAFELKDHGLSCPICRSRITFTQRIFCI